MKKFIISLILCILLITSYVSAAESKEFVVYSELKDLSACGCQTLTDSITIYNTFGTDSWYKIESSQEWVTVDKKVTSIKKGASQKINVDIAIPCSSKSDSYSLTITSLTGYQRVITKNLNIDTCQNLKTALVSGDELVDSNNTINPCETIEYDLYIQNSGPFQEEYNYILENDPEVNGSILINPLETEIIPISYTPSCSIYGEEEIILKLETSGSKLKATLSNTITINQNYDFTIAVPAYEDNKLYVCKDTLTSVPLKLINLVDLPNKYSISLNAPTFVNISENYVELDELDEKELTLEINPTEKGEYNIILTANSEYGDAKSETELTIISQNCYDVSLESEVSELYSCEDNDFIITITNNADLEQTFQLTTHEIAELDVNEITLDAGESSPVIMTIDNPKDDQEYWVYFNVYNNGRELASTTFKYGALSDYSCTKIEVDKSELTINYDDFKKKFRVTNEGLQFEKYFISTEGPEWTTISEDEIELFGGESKELYLNFEYLNQFENGDYPFTITFFSENTEETYEYTINIKLKDKSDFEKAYDSVYAFFIGDTPRNVMFWLIVVLLIMIIILITIKSTAPKYPYKVKNKIKQKKSLLWWLIVLFITVVVWVFLLGGDPYFPQASHYVEESSEPNVIQWAEDTQYSFNLSEYVSDPDRDLLELEVSDMDHINSLIDVGVVTFIPETDWFGEENVFFIATDVFGKSSTSEILTLRVIDVPEFTFWDYFKPFLWSVNLFIFLCILTVFFFMFIVHNRRKKTEKKGNGKTSNGKK